VHQHNATADPFAASLPVPSRLSLYSRPGTGNQRLNRPSNAHHQEHGLRRTDAFPVEASRRGLPAEDLARGHPPWPRKVQHPQRPWGLINCSFPRPYGHKRVFPHSSQLITNDLMLPYLYKNQQIRWNYVKRSVFEGMLCKTGVKRPRLRRVRPAFAKDGSVDTRDYLCPACRQTLRARTRRDRDLDCPEGSQRNVPVCVLHPVHESRRCSARVD
jgi:hypothetical protein